MNERINIGDNIIVPSSDEIAEIEFGLFQNGMTLKQAYFNIALEIIPPDSMLECLETAIRLTNQTWLDIFTSCKANINTIDEVESQCTHVSMMVGEAGSPAYLVFDRYSGRSIYIPNKEAFEHIQFRIVNRGDRLADAYEKEGDDYKSIIPESYILPAIKLLYTNFFDSFNALRQRIPNKYGDWIFDEACIILRGIQMDGRINIGDGFIVPNETEQGCIVQQMFNNGKTLSQALTSCCPDITYPQSVLVFLENELRTTSFPFYSAVRYAWTKYRSENTPHERIVISDGLVVPSSDEIKEIIIGLNSGMNLTQAYFNIANDILPPENMRQCIEDKIRNASANWMDVFKSCQGGNNKTLYYVIGGALALILLSSYS